MREGYKETEIGVIPVDWKVTTIGKSSVNFDGQRVPLKSEDRQAIQGEYPYYGAQGIIDYVNDYIFDGEYLLVAEDGENVKGQKYDIAFIVNDRFWVNNHAHILQANANINLHFISNVLNHINIIKYVTGTGQPKLNKAQLNSIKIPLPPLKEQEKIADILSTADDKIEAIASQIQKAETLKKGLLQKLLSEGIGHTEFKDSELGRIPVSWEVKKLSEVTIINPNSLTNTTEPSYLLEYIDIASIQQTGQISETSLIEFSDAPSRARRIVTRNDILLSTVRPYLKSFAIVKEDKDNLICSTGYAVLRVTETTYYQYIYQFILTDVFMEQVNTMLVGSNYPAINSNDVKNIRLPFPPLKEQKQIANILSTADRKLEVLRVKKEKYETLKQGLMQKLLTGEVRVSV